MRFSGFEPRGRLKQQIRFQTTFLSTSHHGNQTKAVHRHTHVGSTAGKTIIRSGGDTTLKGAQLIGKGVQADTRNLHIESVQDTETYQSKQQNGNVQVTVGYGLSAGGSYSQSKVKADHASVTEQSGIYAGEDGYQIKVRDNTDLKGGIITSSQSAEDKGKNLFQTATLTHSDIQNHSRYEGKSFGIGGSFDLNGGWDGTVTDKQGRPADRISPAIGYGSDGDSKNSTTRSGINTRNIHITDEAGQLARTGRTAEETEAHIHTGIDTETADRHSGRLKNSFDKDAVAKEINLQREVTQEFGKNAAQAAAAVSDKLGNTQSYERYQAAKTLLEAELQNTDSETEKAAIRATLGQVNAYLAENRSRYDTWKEGGIGRSILHGATGGLTTGSLGGILAGGGTSLAAPYLDKAAENLGPAGKAAVNALGGAAIGYAAGGSVGTAAVGANVDWNNRQLHDSEIRKIKDNAAKFAKLHPGISQRQAEERLVAQAMRQVDAAYYAKHADTDTAAEQFLRSIAGSFKADGETFLDFAPMKYYRDSGKFAEHTGYRDLRAKLGQNPVHTEAQRNRTIEEKTYGTIGRGVGKGIGNTLANNLQAGPPHYVLGITNYSNWGKELIPYENPVERAIGKQVEDMTEKAVAAVSLGRSLPSKVVNVNVLSKLDKSIKTAETHKPLVQKRTETYFRVERGGSGNNQAAKAAKNTEKMKAAIDQTRSGVDLPYDSRQIRAKLEKRYGAENIVSTTIPKKPVQSINNQTKPDYSSIVYTNKSGKVVNVKYKDPISGESKAVNIAYDNRGLPIFDNVSNFTTKIDNSLSYTGQMRAATKDLWKAIESGQVPKNQFTNEQLTKIKAGNEKIPGYTWHHNAQSSPNNMQLIPNSIHTAVRHTGQKSLKKGQ